MKIKLFLSGLMLLALSVMTISCGKDDEPLPEPVAAFTPSKTTATVGEAITFTNESTNATSYTWSFGDGTTSTEEAPSKTFAAAGTFKVTLVAKGAGGSNSKDQDITVVVGTQIYFIDTADEAIKKFSISNPTEVSTFLDVTGAAGVGLAFDATNNKVYFSDFNATDDGKVWRLNADGTGLTNIVSSLYDVYGIALNVAGGKIYMTDDADASDVGHIYQTNLDGTGKVAVVTQDGAGFRAVALDLTNNKMYYYEVNDENLWMANLDGTNPQIAVAGVYGYAILVDAANSKIYFDDQNSGDGELKSASLTGTNVTTVDATASRIYGIAKNGDKLYWSARDNGEIYQASLSGTGKVTLKTGLSSPRGIFVKE